MTVEWRPTGGDRGRGTSADGLEIGAFEEQCRNPCGLPRASDGKGRGGAGAAADSEGL